MKISTDKHCEHARIEPGSAGEYVQRDIPVDGSPGLALRVSSDGRKVWTFRFRRQSDGKQRRLALGPYPGVALKEARERARKAINGVSDGIDPAADKQARRAADTVAAVAGQWLAFKTRQGRRASYMKDCRQRITRIPDGLAEMKLQDVRRVDITAALGKVIERGESETNAMHRLLSSIFKWSVSEGFIDFDPSAGIKKRFSEKVRTRRFDTEEIRKFWTGVGSAKADEPTRIAMKLCLVTGQRPNEIVSLRRGDIELDGLHPMLTVSGEAAKNHDAHTLPLPGMAIVLLRRAVELAGGSEWVFPSPKGDGPIKANALSKVIGRARDKAVMLFGMPDAQLYDCKTTVASWLGDADFTNEQIGILLNHRTAKTKSVTGKAYNHSSYLPTKRRMIDMWTRHLEAVLTGAPGVVANNVVTMQR